MLHPTHRPGGRQNRAADGMEETTANRASPATPGGTAYRTRRCRKLPPEESRRDSQRTTE